MTRLSNRQYQMLQSFAALKGYMSIEQAKSFDQRPFRSMLVQKWITFRSGYGFHITRAGFNAWHEFLTTDIARKDPTQPLTAYFNARAYGIRSIKSIHHATNNRELQIRP